MPRPSLAERFACSPGGPDLEDAIRWSADNGFRCVVFTTESGANGVRQWPDERVARVLRACADLGVRLVIHTFSAVNTAEFVPYMSEAVDEYLAANVHLAGRLRADVIVHAGLTFRERFDVRKRSSLEHLATAADLAEKAGVVLYLENMNREPEHAEVHYLGESIEEMREHLSALPLSSVKWAFSANHAQLQPGGFDSFIDALGVERIGIVMVADCRGEYEEHLLPGQGTLNFGRLFDRLEAAGYPGYYLLTFGPRPELLAGREHIIRQVGAAAR
jgi:sugar phosphate isomerase/epimerase